MAHGHAVLPPGAAPAREVFLVLPGLNLHPARLDPLRALLHESGAATLLPDLAGFGAPADPRPVTARQWLADVSAAHRQARAGAPGAPVSVLAYSLGAALALAWSRETGNPWARALLLAPALALRAVPRLALGPLALLPGSWRIPSAAPRSYRLHGAVSVHAYRALRRLLADAAGGSHGPHPGASFVAVSPRDELVSPGAARRYWQERDREQPGGAHRLHWIVHRPRPGWLHHLAVDAETVGAAPWSELQAAAADWLAATAPDAAEAARSRPAGIAAG